MSPVSVCNRYGALWGYFKPNEVKISCDSDVLESYTWSYEYLSFCHCKKCGCVTHYQTLEKADTPVTALNFRMAELTVLNSIKIRYLDGVDTWKYFD